MYTEYLYIKISFSMAWIFENFYNKNTHMFKKNDSQVSILYKKLWSIISEIKMYKLFSNL